MVYGSALTAWCVLQVGVFSATLPPDALEITRKFMNKPVRLLAPFFPSTPRQLM
jgi:superfamily II DNA/RNA helicase